MPGMIELTLPFPPSMNVYWRRGKFSTYLSPAGRKFKQDVSDIVSEGNNRIEGRLSVFLRLFSPSKRAYDIDNRIKATLDALQDAGVFDDDEQIDKIVVLRGPIIKGGCCKVVITNA